VTGAGWVTRADRNRWQRDAVLELAAVLDAHGDLPVIAWTIGPAGGSLSGRVGAPVPAIGVRAAFAAWRHALALDDVAEIASTGGASVYLRARAWRGGVRITVTATVFAGSRDDEDAVIA
jgi:hypothetical protein